MKKTIALLLIANLLLPSPAIGCMWDYDTILVERNTFPTVNELIAGNFIRHSDEYYQWRIDDRSSKPKSDWTPETYDDVAVAFEKLKQTEKAIEMMLEKRKRFPDQAQYETAANLGTFLIHAQRYEDGLEEIKAAIKINPDAHFGREKYQQLLVEFLLSLKKEEVLPVSQQFDEFVLKSPDSGPFQSANARQAEIGRAIEGVSGMIRFGNYDSPILLSALGDLLKYGDSKRLAARAYLRAAKESTDANHVRILNEKAKSALEMQVGADVDSVDKKLRDEMEQGQEFFARISADEHQWIEQDLNVDEKFKTKYYMEPKLVYNPVKSPMNIFLIVSFLVVVVFLVSKRKVKTASR